MELPTCRICITVELDAELPIKLQCKCIGSIGFMHKTCMKEWISVSRRSDCELCGDPFIKPRDLGVWGHIFPVLFAAAVLLLLSSILYDNFVFRIVAVSFMTAISIVLLAAKYYISQTGRISPR